MAKGNVFRRREYLKTADGKSKKGKLGPTWFLRYRDTVVEDGKLVPKWVLKQLCPVAFGHERLTRAPAEVLELAEEEMRAVNSSSIEPSKNMSLQDFVTNVYFVNAGSQKRASTLKGYRARWDSQLKARCGHVRLRDFRTPQAHKVLADIGREHPEFTRSTLHHFRSLLSAIFRHAIQQGYLTGGNPVREAQIPSAPEGNETYAYSLSEVMQMLRLLPDPARTIVAVAAFLGLRRGEIRGLQWPDYTGDEIRVMRSVWESVTNEPKTRKSKAPVPVIVPMQRLLDQYRASRGNPASGPIFGTMKGTPLSLNNVLNREILPVLNACVCGKAEDEHENEDHKYERGARPEWHGWHAFRRGLATNLHSLGIPDKTIQAILRHANVQVTENSYIKTLDSQSIAAIKALESVVDVKMLSANSESEF